MSMMAAIMVQVVSEDGASGAWSWIAVARVSAELELRALIVPSFVLSFVVISLFLIEEFVRVIGKGG